jgi:DNA polymerase (family 10)
MQDKHAIAAALRELGTLLELQGENPFKVRAYENGAKAIEALDDLPARVAAGTLTDVAGIGDAMAKKATELFQTGKLGALEKVRADVPPILRDLARLPGVGPKHARALHEALRLASLEDLKAACEAGKVRGLPGFGEKSEQKILEGLSRATAQPTRFLLSFAREVGLAIVEHVRFDPAVAKIELAGSARRWRETAGDLDVVVGSAKPDQVMDRFVTFPDIEEVEGRGDTKCTARLVNGMQVDLRVVPPGDFATALHYLTGSKGHNVKLRGRARDLGFTLSEWALSKLLEDGSAGPKVRVATEAELYEKLGLPFIPPELREDEGEIEAALLGKLPDDLIEEGDIAGMTHCHTTFSDGKATVEEMAKAAEAMGMQYLTITDHSPTASYAGGVREDRLKAQWDEIARVQEKVKVKLLRGTESDILETGKLDYPERVLEQLDVVIASIHTRHKLDADQMTKRIVHAMKLPVFKIWGHPLGGLLLERDPFECHVEKVLDAIAESRAAVEVNGDPHRLDLAPKWIRLARQRGIRFLVSTDAHSTQDLQNLPFGVHTARRGWVRKGEVLNALPLAAFKKAVRPGA